MAKDWFRKTTWSAADQDDFFEHLQRSHVRNRPQYLRIQAYHLQETGDPEHIEAAISLLECLINDYPESMELNLGWLQKAECHDQLNETDHALQAFRASFRAIRKRPNIRPNTHFAFGMFVIKRNMVDLFDEALAMLDEFTEEADFLFPVQRYQFFAIGGIMASRRGEEELAKECAKRALDAANQSHSGFSYHPSFGVVERTPPSIHAELQQIVA